MIIEAFAKYLQASNPEQPAVKVLVKWLWERLTLPAQNNVDRVIKHEISIEKSESAMNLNRSDFSTGDFRYTFVPVTASGSRLLKLLYDFAMSYEQQKWSRFVHHVKASDFNSKEND